MRVEESRPRRASRTRQVGRLTALIAVLAALVASPAWRPQLAAAATADVVAWGDNASGQLGDGGGANSTSPLQVTGLTAGVIAVAAHDLHGLALLSNNTVVAWGANFSGQLGDGTTTDRVTPVAVQGITTATAIAAGGAHNLALLSSGAVVAWGANNWGQLGNGTTKDSSTPVPVTGLGSGVVAIAAGGAHSLALRSDGSVVAWGGNAFGSLGAGTRDHAPHPIAVPVNTLSSGVVAVAAGAQHSLALLSTGAVVAWGANSRGQVGDNTTVVKPVPVAVSGLTSGVTAIAAGSRFSLALTTAGGVMAWGSNQEAGQLGDGTTTNRHVPVQVTGLTSGVTAITAGGAHALALMSTGTVQAWGANQAGQLGDGTTVNRSVPVAVAGLSGVGFVAAGGSHSVALITGPGTAPTGPPPAPHAGPAPLVVPVAGPASPEPPPGNVDTTPPDITSFGNPVLAADASHPGRIAIAYATGSKCRISLSSDGGTTWAASILVGAGGALPNPVTPVATYDGCSSPRVAYGPDGTLYYAFTATVGFGYGNVFLTASLDEGRHFIPPRQVDVDSRPPTDPSGGDADFAGDLTVDQNSGQLYVIWLRTSSVGAIGGSIDIANCGRSQLRSYIAGGALACFSSTRVSPAGVTATSTRAVAVGPDGRVYVAWLDSGEENNATYDFIGPYYAEVAASTDQARTFGPVSVGDRLAFVCPNFTCLDEAGYIQMSLAAGTAPGEVFLATSGGQQAGAARVSVSVSHDGATSWASRQQVGLVTGLQSHGQHLPHVAVAPSGRVDVDYYDLGTDGFQSVDLVSSNDHGATFSAPRTLTSLASNEVITSSSFSDDNAIGLASADGGFYAAWADSRLGTVDNGKVDVFFATDIPFAPTAGYWLVGADGGVFPFGAAGGFGSTGGIRLNQPMVGMAPTPDGRGYWLVASDGGVFPFGDAGGFGSTGGIRLNQPIVGMAPTPDGRGYWLVAADGGVFPFGDAGGFGSTGGIRLNQPVVGMAATPDGGGYWLVAADGGMFPFGDAGGFGSTGGIRLNQPMVGMAGTPDGRGYWLVASDGGVFPFGDAGGFGSTGGIRLNQPMVGMAATPDGGGYWLVAADGGIFPFGNAPGLGSTGAVRLNKPIVGMAAKA